MKKGVILVVWLVLIIAWYFVTNRQPEINKEQIAPTNEYSDIVKDAFEDVVIPGTEKFENLEPFITSYEASEDAFLLKAIEKWELTNTQVFYPDDWHTALQDDLNADKFLGVLPQWTFLYTTSEESYVNQDDLTMQIQIQGESLEWAFTKKSKQSLERQVAEMHLLQSQNARKTVTYSPWGNYVLITFEQWPALYVKANRIYDWLKFLVDINSLVDDNTRNQLKALYVWWSQENVIEWYQALSFQ